MKALDLIFAARPLLHLPIWSIYLVALHYQGTLSGSRSGWGHAGMLACLSLLAGGAYYLNQAEDLDSDRVNRKLGFLQGGLLSRQELMAAHLIASVAAIACASLMYSFITLTLLLQFFVLGYVYSAPPLRLKDRSVAGLLLNAYCFGFLVPFTVMPELDVQNIIGQLGSNSPLYFFVAVAAVYLLTTLPDREGDRAVGKRTLGVVLSPPIVKLLALVAFLLAAYVALKSQRVALLWLALLSSLPVLLSLFIPTLRLVLFAAKFPVLLLTVLAGYYYPGYLIFIVVLLFACRIYYWKRFNRAYPALA